MDASLWLEQQTVRPVNPAAVFAAESLLAARLVSTLWQRSGEPSWGRFLQRWSPLLPETRLFRLEPAPPIAGGPEAAAACYVAAVPRQQRLGRGQFFTPAWLARHMVESLNLTLSDRCAEPAAGCGVFVAELVRRYLELGAAPAGLNRRLWAVEVSPLLALCTRVQFYLALPEPLPLPAPVTCADALAQPLPPDVTILVGNPPWVPMSALTPASHEQAVALFRQHDMVPPGRAVRLGEGNADLCAVFAVHLVRQLPPGGRAALLLKRDVLVNAAGAALRRRLTRGDIGLVRVDDLSALRLFDSQSGCVLTEWKASAGASPHEAADGMTRAPDALAGPAAVPVYTWTAPGQVRRGSDLVLDPAPAGGFPYPVRHGVKHDRAAVFELRPVRSVPGGIELAGGDQLERQYVYPLLKSRHLRAWGITGYTYALVPQKKAGDHSVSPAREPLTYAYLCKHEAALRARRSAWFRQGPFYSIFGVGPYTWAPYRVAWCRMGRPRGFAVVGEVDDPLLGPRTLLPDHTFLMIPCAGRAVAHYLCACLNSSAVAGWLRDHVPPGKSGLTAGIIRNLRLPRFDPAAPLHMALVAASEAAHAAFPRVPAALQAEVDALAAKVLG